MRDQGLVVVEPDDDGVLVLLPDGVVRSCRSALLASLAIQRWASYDVAQHGDGALRVEWRGGLLPPPPVQAPRRRRRA